MNILIGILVAAVGLLVGRGLASRSQADGGEVPYRYVPGDEMTDAGYSYADCDAALKRQRAREEGR